MNDTTSVMQGQMQTPPREAGQEPLYERLCFEEMLSDLSARFMAIPFEQVDSEIDHALRQIMEFFQVDRCALLEFQHEKALARVTHIHCAEGVEQVSGEVNLAELFPWCYERLIHGNPINISRVEDYPEDAVRDRQSHVAMETKSALNIPVVFAGAVVRSIVIQHIRRQHVWPEEYIPRLRLLGGIFASALERRDDRLKLEELLRFETLQASLSARFVDPPPDRVDDEIDDALRRICELLGIDLAVLWQWSKAAPLAIAPTNVYSREGFPPPEQLRQDQFPWFIKQMLAGSMVAVSSLDAFPAEAAVDRESCRLFGVKSNLTLPLSVGGASPIGAIGFNTTLAERDWPATLVQRLQLTAQVIASALARKRADQVLRTSEERLRTSEARIVAASDAAGLGFYETGEDARVVFLDDRVRALLGVPPEEELRGREYWLAHIHPEDLPRMKEESRGVRTGGLDHVVSEYRYLHPSRGLLWLQHVVRVLERNAAGYAILTVGALLDITARKQAEQQLKQSLEEIKQLRDRLQTENIYLREQMRSEAGHGAIVGESEPLQRMLALAKKVAPTDAAVLITGETGTGKELLAQAVHDLSRRNQRLMVKVNCAALPAPLIESELFGREKGAYTGAMTQQVGRFEVANGSTIFLDEIGDLPLDLQAKLLRVLQDGRFERLGSHHTLKTDARLIAATNHNLGEMVAEGKFREDLFHRLNVFPIEAPPLRARVADIPLLVWKFVQEFNAKMGRSVESIPKPAMEQLKQYRWPGNVRELRNVIERAMIISEGRSLKIELPEASSPSNPTPSSLEEVERKHILDMLERAHWRIRGRGGAAEILGLQPTTLYSRMKKLGISRPESR